MKGHKQTQDILDIIKDQHDILRKSIKVLKDDSAEASEKQDELAEFIHLLNIHTEAEEETVYDVLKDIAASEISTLESYEEHLVAKNLVQELEDFDYKSFWNAHLAAKAKALALLVENHAKLEETNFFRMARSLLTKEELISLGEEFLQKCEELKMGLDIPLHSPGVDTHFLVE